MACTSETAKCVICGKDHENTSPVCVSPRKENQMCKIRFRTPLTHSELCAAFKATKKSAYSRQSSRRSWNQQSPRSAPAGIPAASAQPPAERDFPHIPAHQPAVLSTPVRLPSLRPPTTMPYETLSSATAPTPPLANGNTLHHPHTVTLTSTVSTSSSKEIKLDHIPRALVFTLKAIRFFLTVLIMPLAAQYCFSKALSTSSFARFRLTRAR